MSNRSEADIKEAISGLEQLLDSGAMMVTIDGETTQFDLSAAAARLKDLKAELATLQGKKTRRPIFNRVDLS
jgi:multidrug resistance efflux pump